MYSKSPITLMRRRPHVEPMFRGETVRWNAPFPNNATAARWAFCVRECLWVAKKNPKRFPDLARFSDQYIVEVLDEKTVQASIPPEFLEGLAGVSTALVLPQAHQAARAGAHQPITYADAQTRLEIVQCLLKRGPGDGPFYFPNGALSQADLAKLASWGAAQTPALVVLKTTGAGVTIARDTETIPTNARVLVNE